MRFGSLFTGIGGLDLGLERAGMTCAWQVEINQYCRRVLEKHWPHLERLADVRECGAHNLEPVDLICGGFPCQPHSVAGKRRGAADDRNLWPEYRRIIAELRPRYVLGENVPGIITTMLDEVLSDLACEGYACATIILPAVAFDAPHRRDRVFIVAYAQQVRLCGMQASRDARALESAARQTCTTRRQQTEGSRHCCQDVADADSEQAGWAAITRPQRNQWAVEPDVGRVADGVPRRMDRLRALGNAVVPQVAEWIGRRILGYEEAAQCGTGC